jgi:outer membrane lipoprotein SlyB
MIDQIKKLLILSSIIFVSCNNMVEGVNKSDTQKINTVKYGTLVAAEPVKIKGEDDGLGAITGGLLGAVIGCGEGIFDDECRDTVAVVGAIGGAILGNAVASRLGDHDGFQYVVDIDNSDEDISIIQSGEEQIPIGSKVTVSIGSNTRIIISE